MAKKKLKNGWKYFKDELPRDTEKVIVTNNPDALDAFGQMSHIWILQPIRIGKKRYVGFDAGERRVESLIAWHRLPGKAL